MGNKKPQAIDWKSRIVGHGKQPADQFLHHPNNPKIHPQNQQDALAGAISEIGFISPVIVNRTTGYLIDGHERVWLAMQTNAEVDYVEVELTPEEEAYALVTLDPIGYLARHDSEKLGTLLQDVHSADEAVMTMLSELAEASGVIPALANDETGGDVPELSEQLNEKWQCRRGNVWQIGRHRLMCGDASNPADVKTLMSGDMAALVITDPPYGVEYGSKNEFLNAIDKGNHVQSQISGDYGNKKDIQSLWRESFRQMADVMRRGAVVYCFMPQGGDQMMMMMMMLSGAGIEPKHELIWLKNNHVLGRVDYAYKHEPILYAWKDSGHKFYGDFQTSILEFDKPTKSEYHPTTKPIPLIVRLLQNSSLQNEIVYDPFCGSGTTLMACENTGREGRGMEIEPKYCAVILERLSNAGLPVELLP